MFLAGHAGPYVGSSTAQRQRGLRGGALELRWHVSRMNLEAIGLQKHGLSQLFGLLPIPMLTKPLLAQAHFLPNSHKQSQQSNTGAGISFECRIYAFLRTLSSQSEKLSETFSTLS